jgi:hypothetical protein
MRINNLVSALALVALTGLPALRAETEEARVREAVEKSVAQLLPSGPLFVKRSGCVSCHNNTLPLMAASMARERGMRVDTQNEMQQLKAVIGVTSPMREPLVEATYAVPDTQVSLPYILMALYAEHVPADGLTAAAVHGIAAKQLADGSWPSYINRAPIENGDIQATAMSVRALQLYGMPGRSAEWKRRTGEAREWLTRAAGTAKTTEDKIMLVSGLAWSGAPAETISAAARKLMAEQRADGGWAQLTTLESDAYATGKVLVSLHEAGILRTGDEAYRRGVEYLLRTQQPDGTWMVKARAFPFQPLKESGFPHGRDQWISAAGTSWAAMALACTVEPATAEAGPEMSFHVGDEHNVVGAKTARVDQIPGGGPVE